MKNFPAPESPRRRPARRSSRTVSASIAPLRLAGWLALGFVPALLGAKGCDLATIGDERCGGLQGLSCEEGEFCSFAPEAICGAADATGTCEPIPEACTEIFSPVCGCDGNTYGNECEANAAGVSVAASGACGAGGNACGGFLGLACEAGEFCDFAPDALCGAADQTGICSPVPEACDQNFDPVCGCDGNTYGNECEAHAVGVSVAASGECGAGSRACGGLLGLSCAEGEFCSFAPDAFCGAADATGLCEPVPAACLEIFAPVCGCDGNTYGNECEAHAAGVSVASSGACGGGERVCGTRGAEPCAEGEFCNFPLEAACGATDRPGVCEPTPQACTRIFAPVCGCDGVTYSNECAANSAGVSVATSGECGGGNACGGLLGLSCAAGEFCDFAPEALCGAADQTGTCSPVPEACNQIFDPVCGCDGNTYGNECAAHAAGVSVAASGACGGVGNDCGGFLGLACEAGEFCNFAPEALCGAADATGECEPVPEVCLDVFDPVCGCDGNTYGNECQAHVAGTSVVSVGACQN